MHRIQTSWLTLSIALLAFPILAADGPTDLQSALKKLRAVEAEGKGNREATAAWQSLAKLEAAQLPDLLAGMDGAGPLAENWLRSAADAIAERTLKSGGKLPVMPLEKFLRDQSHSPRARRVAFEWLVKSDPSAKDRLIPTFVDDSSVELRREAVAALLAKLEGVKDNSELIAGYQKALDAARDLDQIESIAKKLVGLKAEPKLSEKLGFVQNWKVVAPFDNVKRVGFDTAFPPEKAIDLKASYPGKEAAKIEWSDLAAGVNANEPSPGKVGLVDLKKKYDNLKGVVAYAYCEVEAEKAGPVEFRLGTYNANKLWVNGQLVMANDVYHGGMEVDQYVARGNLKAGKNTILLKIAQNEQTEPWTHVWQFQFRICDAIGTPIPLK